MDSEYPIAISGIVLSSIVALFFTKNKNKLQTKHIYYNNTNYI